VQVLDYLREMAHSITFINKPILDHIDNNHKSLLEIQIEELTDITRMTRELIRTVNTTIKSNEFDAVNELVEKQNRILKYIDTSQKKQVKRIKANEVGTRNSMLYLGLLSESKNLLLHTINVLKAQRDFATHVKNGELKLKD
jgi:Na+/phosphate symporter